MTRNIKVYFLLIFFGISASACELRHKYPFKGLSLEQKMLLFEKNEQIEQTDEIVERIHAIEDRQYHTRACKNMHAMEGTPYHKGPCIKNLPDGYLVVRYHEKNNEIKILGMLSSKRQLQEMFSPAYNYLLSTESYIALHHFKTQRLKDGELAQLGVLILGSNDIYLMYELIHLDLLNDYENM